jgi:hypothetical protein
MNRRAYALLIGMGVSCLFLIFALSIFHQHKRKLALLHHQLLQQQQYLKERLHAAEELDNQIKKQEKLMHEAEEKGFFHPYFPHQLVQRLKSLAQECAIDEIFFTVGPVTKTPGQCLTQLVTVTLRSALDQDVFRFIHRLETIKMGLLLIREVNLFRTAPSEAQKAEAQKAEAQQEKEADVVTAEIRFEIVHFDQERW